MKRLLHIFFSFCIIGLSLAGVLEGCTIGKQIDKTAKQDLINKPGLTSAHVGICIYDPSENKYLYDYQDDKYFIPASNTKIITCYAGMKYLGDSLIGLRYKEEGNKIYLVSTGDPTFIHPDFNKQPVISYLSHIDSNKIVLFNDANFQDEVYGDGWAWNDYMDDYMVERSAIPVYGNIVTFEGTADHWSFYPSLKGNVTDDSTGRGSAYLSKVNRDWNANTFRLTFKGTAEKKFNVPFYTAHGETNINLLQTLVKAKLTRIIDTNEIKAKENYQTIKSQPTDSLLKIMMHRSDNFYAEQCLLMVSNETLGVMNDEKIIDTLLKTDFKDMPQKPKWVDGSGLSRYNLFTPKDFVFVLNKIRNEFSWNRIITIFPTGGAGTLTNFYKNLTGKIYAKTGTLSNNIALSGYIITKKNKTLIFSILVGNHTINPVEIRDNMEQFLTDIVEKY